MLESLNFLREVNLLTTTLRLVLAVLCGGLVGLERSRKRRPAGFRTHILICLGAAMTTLTSQYLYLVMHLPTDISRLGAQVIAGIGFIGAGTIIVTRHRRVKGLTTAAGLWTSAIIGLACGMGYYEGAIYATILILLAELVFSRLEYRLMRNAREMNLLVGYREGRDLNAVIRFIRDMDLKINDIEISKDSSVQRENGQTACANFVLQMNRRVDPGKVVKGLSELEGVTTVEEL